MLKKILWSLLAIAVVAVLFWVFTTNWALRDGMDISVVPSPARWWASEVWTIEAYNGYKCSAHTENQYEDGSYVISFRFDPPATKPPNE